MPIKYITGDLFKSKDCLAHCVSKDLRMSRGIAVEFKRRFGGMLDLASQKKQIGEVACLVNKKWADNLLPHYQR